MIFKILIVAFYMSLVLELVLLAIPSPVSLRNFLQTDANATTKVFVTLLSLLSIISFCLPLLILFTELIPFDIDGRPTSLLTAGMLLLYAGRYVTFIGTRALSKSNIDHMIESGIFKVSRNPVVLGMLISLVALNLIFVNSWLLLGSMIFLANMHIKVVLEEKSLQKRFGKHYEQHRKAVPRYLLI